jgi:1,4-alpha-glucan branching enzyme
MQRVRYDISIWGEMDSYLFKEGSHSHIYEILGAHPLKREKEEGVYFALWAPNAKAVSVIGEFNGFKEGVHPLKLRDDESGVWEGFIPKISTNLSYKYHIITFENRAITKSDPVGFMFGDDERNSNIICDLTLYNWQDKEWMSKRESLNHHKKAINIYEIHLSSWIKKEGKPLNYIELAKKLVKYITKLGYNYIQIVPERYYYNSLDSLEGGYFAPSANLGTPFDFMEFVDILHRYEIGVILEWLPVSLGVNLKEFDGTPIYEYSKSRYQSTKVENLFNYAKAEVREFLISSAMFWFKYYHLDGLKVSSLDYMIYPNQIEKNLESQKVIGRENLDAISFLKQLNDSIYKENRSVMMIAGDSSFPLISRPTYLGGLGFGYKWNTAWARDTLEYIFLKPSQRPKYHHKLIFNFICIYQENYILPLSHKEIIHFQDSFINSVKGGKDIKFATLRLLYSYMIVYPGKKLLFMGNEFGQWTQWKSNSSLDWKLIKIGEHFRLLNLVRNLNFLYKKEPALYLYDYDPKGFEWIDELDYKNSVISFLRLADSTFDAILVVCNFSNKEIKNYKVGVPKNKIYLEIFNSQSKRFGGNYETLGEIKAQKGRVAGRDYFILITLPPLSLLMFKIQK